MFTFQFEERESRFLLLSISAIVSSNVSLEMMGGWVPSTRYLFFSPLFVTFLWVMWLSVNVFCSSESPVYFSCLRILPTVCSDNGFPVMPLMPSLFIMDAMALGPYPER